MKWLAIGLMASVVSTVPAAARADPWHLAASVGTNFPIDVGARVDVEGPLRLRLSTSLGVMPGAYVDAINGIATAAGWYTSSEADLIRIALQSSFVWRTHVGWRPFPRLGFYGMIGYGMVTLGGGASAQQLIAAITGQTPPNPNGPGANYSYSVTSTLHMIDVELGWEFRFLNDRLVLQTALGFAGTLGSKTTIRPQYTPRAPQATQAFTNYGSAYLDDLMKSYVFAPVVTVNVGYRFF